MTWSERAIASALARHTFKRKYLVVVPNCNWTGHECDLLAVTENLRIIDVEIKISRADLKADAKKEKWWNRRISGWEEHRDEHGRFRINRPVYDNTRMVHPPRVWKHYFALPAEIWDDSLLECLPSPASGVILLEDGGWPKPPIVATVVRRATPNKQADTLKPAQAVDIARLASLRMWDAYDAADRCRSDTLWWREKARELGFRDDWEKEAAGQAAPRRSEMVGAPGIEPGTR